MIESPDEEIYRLYPLKVGKPKALTAIRKQLKRYAFGYLKEATLAYAKAIGSRRDFVPHPATWFNQERFNDDASTWQRSSGIGDLKTQLGALETVIETHPANAASASYSSRCSGIQKDELDDLKRKRFTLIKSIATR